jgi:hypothetical protein
MALGYVMTVGDVLRYYAAEGPAARVLSRAAKGRKVQLTDWPETLTTNKPYFEGTMSPQQVEETVRQYFEEALPGSEPNHLPLRYPGFHGTVGRNVVLEIDAKHSQKEAFEGGRRILDLLDRYDAPYRIKFSGNSSPHVFIPASVYEPLVPEAKWDEAHQKLFAWLVARCAEGGGGLDSSFNQPDHFLRLPYSLNERTGLVSLPLRREQYDDFQLSWAEAPNVQVETWWFDEGGLLAKQEGMRRLIQEALGDERD